MSDAVVFSRLGRAHSAEAVRVLHEAFAGDAALHEALALDRRQMFGYWRALAVMCESSRDAWVFGGGRGGAVESVAVVFGPRFRSGVVGTVRYMWSYIRRLGPIGFVRLVRYGLRFNRAADLGSPAFRIAHLGSAEAAQGRGLGGSLLDFVAAQAAAEGLGAVQLEVKAGSPAERLYGKKGFTVRKQMALFGETYHVMVRDLPAGAAA
jgi:GNAT superfamily N-acetyltransferase